MLKQNIKGLSVKNVNVKCSEADQAALVGLLAGEVQVYDLKGEGGTSIPLIPNPLNRKNFIVGANTPTGRISCYVSLPHVKASSDYNAITASIIGKFNASYESSLKSSYATLKFDS